MTVAAGFPIKRHQKFPQVGNPQGRAVTKYTPKEIEHVLPLLPPLTWGVHEVKMHQVINAQLLQLQHHRAQVGPQDFRVRVLLHLRRVRFLRVQAEALARPRAPGSTRPLLSAGLGDGCHQEGLHSDTRVVHLWSNSKKMFMYRAVGLHRSGGGKTVQTQGVIYSQ